MHLKPSQPVLSNADGASPDSLHPAARKLLSAAARHAPARFTWGQLATLAGLKPSGGHCEQGLQAAGEVPPSPSTPAERLALWCGRLPSPAPEILRTLAARGEHYMYAEELASTLGK